MSAYFDLAIEIASTPVPQREQPRNRMSAAWNEIETKHPLIKLLMPAIYRSIENADKIKAMEDATRLAIAFEIFEARIGRVPDALDELVPDILDSIPMDAISGHPFIYKPIPESQWTQDDQRHFLLYSQGTNGVDDDGQPDDGFEDPETGRWHDDIMFTKLRYPPRDDPNEPDEASETEPADHSPADPESDGG